MYRTSNQAYGSRAPTVHEMPVRRRQGRALGVCVRVRMCVRGCVRCVCVSRSSSITNGKGSPQIFLEQGQGRNK